MRDIKFRAWDKEKKQMFDLISWDKDGAISWTNEFGYGKNAYMWNSRNLILMQYTGLKDKNGKGRWSKEIYEGDIVEVIFGKLKGERFIIIYQKEWAAFIADQGEGGHWLFDLSANDKWDSDDKLRANEIKVIGNIYENPDLLVPHK